MLPWRYGKYKCQNKNACSPGGGGDFLHFPNETILHLYLHPNPESIPPGKCSAVVVGRARKKVAEGGGEGGEASQGVG